MSVLRMIPLIGCIAAVYALLALAGTDVPARPLASIGLPSGIAWNITTGDLLLLLAVIALYFDNGNKRRSRGHFERSPQENSSWLVERR